MEQLGIEPQLLLAQIVNFAIIAFVLQKLLFKPIMAMLEKRKTEIEAGLKLTDSMREEEEKLMIKRDKALSKAKEEALAILEDAKKQGKETEKEIAAKAQQQAAEIIERARLEADEIKKNAKDDLQSEAVDIAVQMAKRLLSAIMSEKDQHALIEKHAKDLDTWAKKQA